MNIDDTDIEKGSLSAILPGFHPNSISYLSELNDYRMYAEVWSNKRSKANIKRREIGHAGYLKTLELGEQKKKRRSDKIRFDYFIVANSLNYKAGKDVYGKRYAYIQIGGVQTNTIFNDIIKYKNRTIETQSLHSVSDFHSGSYLPEKLELKLDELDLRQDKKTSKQYFEISTDANSISNQNQRKILSQVLGREDTFEKLGLLRKVGRKQIRCLFENTKNMGKKNVVPRLCVAWPFQETLVFDFAGTPEEYNEACLLGTLANAQANIVDVLEAQTEDTGRLDEPQLDSYA